MTGYYCKDWLACWSFFRFDVTKYGLYGTEVRGVDQDLWDMDSTLFNGSISDEFQYRWLGERMIRIFSWT